MSHYTMTKEFVLQNVASQKFIETQIVADRMLCLQLYLQSEKQIIVEYEDTENEGIN